MTITINREYLENIKYRAVSKGWTKLEDAINERVILEDGSPGTIIGFTEDFQAVVSRSGGFDTHVSLGDLCFIDETQLLQHLINQVIERDESKDQNISDIQEMLDTMPLEDVQDFRSRLALRRHKKS